MDEIGNTVLDLIQYQGYSAFGAISELVDLTFVDPELREK